MNILLTVVALIVAGNVWACPTLSIGTYKCGGNQLDITYAEVTNYYTHAYKFKISYGNGNFTDYDIVTNGQMVNDMRSTCAYESILVQETDVNNGFFINNNNLKLKSLEDGTIQYEETEIFDMGSEGLQMRNNREICTKI